MLILRPKLRYCSSEFDLFMTLFVKSAIEAAYGRHSVFVILYLAGEQ